ncbi:hypothetical protein CPB85DRAFT_1341838, partial [Mucidula mucida]
MSFHFARRSPSSANSTTISPTSRCTTIASPESLRSLALHVLAVYFKSPEKYHLVIPQEDHSALIAFLKGDVCSLYRIQSLLLGSIYTTAFVCGDDIFVRKARLITRAHKVRTTVRTVRGNVYKSYRLEARTNSNAAHAIGDRVGSWHLQTQMFAILLLYYHIYVPLFSITTVLFPIR